MSRTTSDLGAASPRAGGRVGIKQVALAAGVSVGTVSNVLNRPQLVSGPAKRRVLAAIAQLGYVRNESARMLRTGSSRTIGLVVIDAANPFFADVARGVEDAVDEFGGVVLLGNSAGDVNRERRYLELFEEQRVRGVLIAPSGEPPPVLDGLARLGIPVVFLDRSPAEPTFCSVSVDDVAGGRMAADHLMSLGRSRLVFAGGPASLTQVHDRLSGAQAAVEAARSQGSPVSLSTIALRELTTEAGRGAAETIAALPADVRPDAVFAGNDLVALGMLQGLMRHGLRVPEDIALLGYDDIDFATAAAVPLSSVRQPRTELGRTGAELLLEQVKAAESGRRAPARHVQFVPELVVRMSTAGSA